MHRKLILGIATLAGLSDAQGSPEDDPYVPQYARCPSGLKIRSAKDGLSSSEKQWRAKRSAKVIDSLSSYLERADIEGLDVDSLISKLDEEKWPVVGLSVSGGGTQSGFGGLGVWQAFDDRYAPARAARTGGLTQLFSYITGLSGGGAVTVASLAGNNFKSLEASRKETNYTADYTAGSSGNQTAYFTGIFENVGAKDESGFPISVTDVFGQFWGTYLPESAQYKDWSSLASDGGAFAEGTAPMPIIVLTEVIPGKSPEIGKILYPGRNDTNGFNLTSYEVTPYEFGSWAGGRVQAFMPTKWTGTSMNDGTPQNSSQCVRGFDKFTFVQGSTTNAFDAWFIDDFYNIPVFAKRGLAARQGGGGSSSSDGEDLDDIPVPEDQEMNPLVQLVNQTAENFEQTFNQSIWATYPNPFQGYNKAMSNVDELLLIDGSLAGETNPIRPLIIPERKVDFLVVYEASSDAKYNWINGTNLINSAQSAEEGNIPFPKIPNVNTMITQNFTKVPTFFGCNATEDVPLVLYLPNAPWSSYTNFSYEKSSFTNNQLDLTFENAFNVATYGNGTQHDNWPACIACGVIKGVMKAVGMDMPEQCSQCFEKHCWDGQESEATITEADMDPSLALDPGLSYAEWNETQWNAGVHDSSSGGTGSGGNNSSGGNDSSGSDGGGGSSTGSEEVTSAGLSARAQLLSAVSFAAAAAMALFLH